MRQSTHAWCHNIELGLYLKYRVGKIKTIRSKKAIKYENLLCQCARQTDAYAVQNWISGAQKLGIGKIGKIIDYEQA